MLKKIFSSFFFLSQAKCLVVALPGRGLPKKGRVWSNKKTRGQVTRRKAHKDSTEKERKSSLVVALPGRGLPKKGRVWSKRPGVRLPAERPTKITLRKKVKESNFHAFVCFLYAASRSVSKAGGPRVSLSPFEAFLRGRSCATR